MAEGTRNRSLEVLQEMEPITEQVEQWAQNMRDNQYSTTDYERAVSSAGEAGTSPSTRQEITGGQVRLEGIILDYSRSG